MFALYLVRIVSLAKRFWVTYWSTWKFMNISSTRRSNLRMFASVVLLLDYVLGDNATALALFLCEIAVAYVYKYVYEIALINTYIISDCMYMVCTLTIFKTISCPPRAEPCILCVLNYHYRFSFRAFGCWNIDTRISQASRTFVLNASDANVGEWRGIWASESYWHVSRRICAKISEINQAARFVFRWRSPRVSTMSRK